MTLEGLRLRFRNQIYLPLTRNARKKKLDSEQFTIISNNCWGGVVYESYGLLKQSPTIGMFIMPKDFVKMCSSLKYYLSLPLEFIPCEESKWKHILCTYNRWGDYPVARLGDIELQMLHAHGTSEEIREKWARRVERIHWDKILYKFNDQNGCEKADIEDFFRLPLKNKLFLGAKDYQIDSSLTGGNYYVINQPKSAKSILASYEPYGNNKYFNLNEIINRL